jgi:hypothetical protein
MGNLRINKEDGGNMLSLKKSSRLGRWIVATTVAITTFAVVTQATTTITVPNATTLSYNLGAGGFSGAITPPSNIPVLVMGVCTSVGVRGVGHVTLLRIPGSFVEWVGLNSTAGASIAQGFSGVVGTHIVFLDLPTRWILRSPPPRQFACTTVQQAYGQGLSV